MRSYTVDEVILSSPSINGSIEHTHPRGLRGARLSRSAGCT